MKQDNLSYQVLKIFYFIIGTVDLQMHCKQTWLMQLISEIKLSGPGLVAVDGNPEKELLPNG